MYLFALINLDEIAMFLTGEIHASTMYFYNQQFLGLAQNMLNGPEAKSDY